MIEINVSFVIQLINFLVLIFIMDRLLFRPVLAVIDERNRKVEGVKNSAWEYRKKAESLDSDFRGKLSSIRKESMESIERAKISALKEAGVITGEAKDSFSARVSSAKNEIATEAGRASGVLKKETAVIVNQMVSKILGREVA